jgi:hypothetical protein
MLVVSSSQKTDVFSLHQRAQDMDNTRHPGGARVSCIRQVCLTLGLKVPNCGGTDCHRGRPRGYLTKSACFWDWMPPIWRAAVAPNPQSNDHMLLSGPFLSWKKAKEGSRLLATSALWSDTRVGNAEWPRGGEFAVGRFNKWRSSFSRRRSTWQTVVRD